MPSTVHSATTRSTRSTEPTRPDHAVSSRRPHRCAASSTASASALPGGDPQSATARLFAKIAAGTDPEQAERLRDQIVVLNMRVAENFARHYRNRGVCDEDLRQVAYLGLIKAVRRFDPDRGGDFLGYAVPTITGEIKRHFRDFGWRIRPTRRIQDLQAQIVGATDELTQRLGRAPRPREIADALGADLDDVIEALAADGCFTPTSLDLPVGDHDVGTLGELIPTERNGFAAAEARVLLSAVTDSLTARERRILELRFFAGCTQAEIGRQLQLSQMQVSRLLAGILTRLRTRLA